MEHSFKFKKNRIKIFKVQFFVGGLRRSKLSAGCLGTGPSSLKRIHSPSKTAGAAVLDCLRQLLLVARVHLLVHFPNLLRSRGFARTNESAGGQARPGYPGFTITDSFAFVEILLPQSLLLSAPLLSLGRDTCHGLPQRFSISMFEESRHWPRIVNDGDITDNC